MSSYETQDGVELFCPLMYAAAWVLGNHELGGKPEMDSLSAIIYP